MNQPAKSVEPIKTRASRAVAIMAIGSVVGRIVLFASNWILGALLTEETFGVGGLVGMVGAFAWTLVGFGLDDVLVQRGSGLTAWEASVFRSSVAIALAVALGTALLAPALGMVFNDPRVVGPILVVALTFPIASLSIVTGAKLTARMDFGFILTWSLVELFAIQGMTLAFAAIGFGAYSFALPLPIVFALRAVAYYMRAPSVRTRVQSGARLFLLLRKGAAVAGAKIVNCVVGQGDYIVLGLLATTSAVGYYFFAFRLAAAPVRTIALSLSSVLFPAMMHFRGDPLRQSESAVKSAVLVAWLATPFSYFQIAIAAPALHLFFGHKWDQSIAVVQLLGVGLVVEGTMAVTRAYLRAAGKFNLAFGYSLANAIGYIMACITGTVLGSINGMALAASIFYIVTQPATFALLADHTGHRLRNALRYFVLPTAVSGIAFGSAWAVSVSSWVPQSPLVAIAITTFVGWPLFLLIFWRTAPDILQQLTGLLQAALNRRAQ